MILCVILCDPVNPVSNPLYGVTPVTKQRDRKCLGVSLQIPPDVDRSWNLRVKGRAKAESAALLDELDTFLYQKRYLYQHLWRVGDLLIIDNYGTLHGRTAISGNGARCLFRGQVNPRDLVAAA